MTSKDVLDKVTLNLQDKGTLLFLTKFGSHLYGTDTPDSDADYKAIYVPSMKSYIKGSVKDSMHLGTNKNPNAKNSSEDVDIEVFTLRKFLSLLSIGDTMAIDMIHANQKNIVYKDPILTELFNTRRLFYTKNLKSFTEYARKQAAKYGLKGSRLDAIKNLMDVLKPSVHLGKSSKLSFYWNVLPVGEHSRFVEDNPNGIRQYYICGKILQETMSCAYAYDILDKYYSEYGHRAVLAQKNEGVDWKAISHALRAAYQVRQILTEGTLVFPLREAELLRQVKLGNLKYVPAANTLEELIEEVQTLSDNSDLPDSVSEDIVDNYLFSITKAVLCLGEFHNV